MIEHLPRQRLVEILEACAKLRVAVVGDYCLDAYWYADMTRAELSREAPLYARPVMREAYTPGGASSVACNVRSIGVPLVYALSIVGTDWRGKVLGQQFTEAGILQEYLLATPDRVTPTYCKIILEGYGTRQEDARIDFLNPAPPSAELEDQFMANLRDIIQKVDAVAVADQLSNGLLTPRLRQALVEMAASHPEVVFVVDSRDHIQAYRHMVLKPNDLEAARVLFPQREAATVSREELLSCGPRLQEQAERPAYITLGESGAILFEGGSPRSIPAARVEPPIDTVGAGDAFLCALTAGLAAQATPWEAGVLANLAAGVVVGKLNQTGTASPAEILGLYDRQGSRDASSTFP